MKHYIPKEDKDRAVLDYLDQHLSFMVDKATDSQMIVLRKGDETRTWNVSSNSDADKLKKEITQDVKQYLDKLKGKKNGKDR